MNRRKVYIVNEVSFDIPDETSENNEAGDDEVFSDGDKEVSCDWGICRPKRLQSCANMNCAMIWICVSALALGALPSGLINNIVEAAEKRFSIDSTRCAFISSCYYIGILLSSLPISFFGNNSPKPRLMGIGMIIVAVGCAIFCIPSFFQNKIKSLSAFPNITERTCENYYRDSDSCSGLTNWFVAILWIASIILGIGSGPVLFLGIRYIDENSERSKVPVNCGFFCFAYIVGVGSGFAISSNYLPSFQQTNPLHENFFGANWWIVFICMMVAALLLAIPLLCLPKYVTPHDSESHRSASRPSTYKAKRPSEALAIMEYMSSRIRMTCRQFGANLLELCQNSTFLCASLSMAARVAFLSGLITFGQKYSDATFPDDNFNFTYSSIYAIPASIVGIFVGAIFVIYSKGTVSTLLRVMIIGSLSTFSSLCLFLMQCTPYSSEQLSYVGLNVPYEDSKAKDPLLSAKLDDECNANCSCNLSQHIFICGADNRIYYSPCHAGCRTVNGNGTMFGNCSCFSSHLPNNPDYQATIGICHQQCQLFWLFQGMLIFLFLLNSFTIIPHISITLRSIAEKQRTMAFGIQWMIICLFGAIPGPLIFGYAIDLACDSWMEGCYTTGKAKGICVFYQEHELRFTILIISFVSYGLVSIFLVIALLVYRKPYPTRSLEMYLNWQDRRLSIVSLPPDSKASDDKQGSSVDSLSGGADGATEILPGSRLKVPFKIIRLPSNVEDKCTKVISSRRKRQLSEPPTSLDSDHAVSNGCQVTRRSKSVGTGKEGRLSGADVRERFGGIKRVKSCNSDHEDVDRIIHMHRSSSLERGVTIASEKSNTSSEHINSSDNDKLRLCPKETSHIVQTTKL